MPRGLFEMIRDDAWQERIEDGYLRFLNGAFRPPKPKEWFPHETMHVVGARVDPKLQAAVANYARSHAGALGWAPSPKQVAVAWLMSALPPPDGQLVAVGGL